LLYFAKEEAIQDQFDSPRVGLRIKRGIYAERGMIVLGTLLAAASFCFAQGTTEKKTEAKKLVIKQTSASSGKEMLTQYCAPFSRSQRYRERPRGAGHEITANEPDATGQEA
jgi:hypothetical protein